MSIPTAQLPPGWTELPLSSVLKPLEDGRTLHHGWSPQCETEPSKDENEWGVLKTTAIQDGAFLPEHNKRLPAKLKPRLSLEVKEGDLLITCAGPRSRCGVPCLVRQTRRRLILSGKMYRFRVPEDLIDPRYMEAFLRSHDVQSCIDTMKTGISDSGLNLTHGRFGRLPVRFPPVNEQRRIVAKIEELFSDLDAGVAALERVRANLKRYRAAFLNAAFAGRLSKEWREQNPSPESANDLEARTLAERQKRWEAEQLQKFTQSGKAPPKGWREKYVPPLPHSDDETFTLPKTWKWTSWDALLAFDDGAFKRGPFGSALTKSMFVPKGYKVYEQYCPINDDCSFARYFITEEKFREMEGFAVRAGDYLISCSGVTLGRITQVPSAFDEGIINQALLRVRINGAILDARYFLRLFRSPFFQARITDNSTGSAIPNVKGVKELKSMPIPLPPMGEQVAIALEIDRRLSVVQAAEAEIEHSLKRAARLRQSILKRAFEGKLVPQSNEAGPPPTPTARRSTSTKPQSIMVKG